MGTFSEDTLNSADVSERIIDHVYDLAAAWRDADGVMRSPHEAVQDLVDILSIVWEGA